MATSITLGPQPPIATAELAENFDGSTGDRLYDGMVPNWPATNSAGDWSALDADVRWSWPRLGIGEPLARRQWFSTSRGNTTTTESMGLGTAGGTPNETTPGAAKVLTTVGADGYGITYSTTAVIASEARVDSFTSGFMRREMRPAFCTVIRMPSTITSMRMWAGLFAGSSPGNSDDPTSLSGIGFRYTTNVVTGQNAWVSYTNTGSTSAGAGTVGTNTNTVLASTRYELAFFMPTSSSVAFFINGKFFSLHTTRLPATNTTMDFCVGITALSASLRTFTHIRTAGHSA